MTKAAQLEHEVQQALAGESSRTPRTPQGDQTKSPRGPRPFKISTMEPATMTAGAINKELDRLDAQSSALGQQMIDAGRGYERPSEYLRMTDPLAMELRRNSDRRLALRIEISSRYGPNAPGRLPPGRFWGPRKKTGQDA